jgi:hypothetical protein
VAAAGLAVWQARRQASTDSGTTTSVTAAGGRDATAIVGGQGQTAEQIANILHPPPAEAAAGRELPAPGPVSNLPPRNPTFTGRQGATGHAGA